MENVNTEYRLGRHPKAIKTGEFAIQSGLILVNSTMIQLCPKRETSKPPKLSTTSHTQHKHSNLLFLESH
ncbi:CLUMA_CG013794, isoform A [Clunio marinus]|uniref:CLUMA_CG013794, isoform A n=1 Tax=Clunio marinus TaxID=568069 RepID=A0A1J1IJV7_9DIPT|nr:CLUMA_CG013794, isoform A [Clunio marinus]